MKECLYFTSSFVSFSYKKPTRCTNFSNLSLECNSTCFGHFLCPSSRDFTVHTAMVYVIQVCWQLVCKQWYMSYRQWHMSYRFADSMLAICQQYHCLYDRYNCLQAIQAIVYVIHTHSTCFGQFLCPSSGVFHCTHSNGICHTGAVAACEQAVNKHVWHIPLVFVQWKTPDDG
jgi:hypothetical protein